MIKALKNWTDSCEKTFQTESLRLSCRPNNKTNIKQIIKNNPKVRNEHLVRTLWKSLNHSAEQIVSVPSVLYHHKIILESKVHLNYTRVIFFKPFSFIKVDLQVSWRLLYGTRSQVNKTENLQYQSKVLQNDRLIVLPGYWFSIRIFLYQNNHFSIKKRFFRNFDNEKFWQGVAYRVIRYIRFPDCK